ncbi:MAG: class I SAM-dependent methyltransferase [Pseudomonadota bacterium]
MSEEVRRHYATSRNLAARGSLQAKYATVDWFGWLTDTMRLPADADILDVGCGPAWFWRNQADRVPPGLCLTMIDTSPGMIAEAKANLATTKRIDAAVADAIALPFADGSFDVVLLLHVLYHVGDPRKALTEARRVLRPRGRVFASTNTRDSLNELHVLGARVFGGDAVDLGAALFSLDDAESLLGDLFGHVRRYDLTDVMACTDPDDAVAYLLSIPPGIDAPDAKCEELARLVRQETERGGGVLRMVRRNGLVEGTKPS